MRRYLSAIFVICMTTGLFARTPAETLIYKYENVRGAKVIEASGGKMVFVRPVLKKYPIGPMADYVEGVVVLRMEKADDKDVKTFLAEFKTVAAGYKYYGKSDTPNGEVDVYVKMKSDKEADELVIYNPGQFVLNSLSGKFPVSELLALDKKGK